MCVNPVLRNAVLAQLRKESWYVLSAFLDISLMEAILVLIVLLAVLNAQIKLHVRLVSQSICSSTRLLSSVRSVDLGVRLAPMEVAAALASSTITSKAREFVQVVSLRIATIVRLLLSV